MDHPAQRDYEALAAFRKGLRAFLRFSEQLNAEHGSTQAIYQLMLVIKAQSPHEVDIACAAREMSLRHHSAAELVSRAEIAGLVVRRALPDDLRRPAAIRPRCIGFRSRIVTSDPSGTPQKARCVKSHRAVTPARAHPS